MRQIIVMLGIIALGWPMGFCATSKDSKVLLSNSLAQTSPLNQPKGTEIDHAALTTQSSNPEAKTSSSSRLKVKPTVIVIIDDMGDNFRLGKRLIDVNVPLNFAFLPNTPFAKKLASLGHQNGHDIMLHFPMEATTRPDLMGKGSILSSHSEFRVKQIFDANLQQIPFVQGFNNHMGSLLTQSSEHMDWLMNYARTKSLYFVDSKTASGSIAFKTANHYGIPSLNRDVFLDPAQGGVTVIQQLEKALRLADRSGMAVVIGHPHRTTVEVLERELPAIAHQYRFITVSQYWHEQGVALNNRSTSFPFYPSIKTFRDWHFGNELDGQRQCDVSPLLPHCHRD